jgi:hypothetical protein
VAWPLSCWIYFLVMPARVRAERVPGYASWGGGFVRPGGPPEGRSLFDQWGPGGSLKFVILVSFGGT